MDPNNSNPFAQAGSFEKPHPLATAEPSTTENPHTATSSTAAATDVLSEDCAVNAWGWGIQIPDCIDRNNITVLNADSPASKYGDFAQVYAEHAKHGPPGRSPFYFTARELNEGSAYSYILVGFAVPLLDKQYRRLAPSHRGADYTMDNNAMTLVPGVAADALVMVVAPVTDVPQAAKLYALLDTPSGLCVPYTTGFEHCFYLPMFRAEVGKREHLKNNDKAMRRRAAWNKRVRSACMEPEIRRQTRLVSGLPAVDGAMDNSEETPQPHEQSNPGTQQWMAFAG